MPLECVVIRCAAQNHVVSGNLERCITVPAVTEVCRPQSRHSCKRGRLFSAATRRLPQAGQTKPSGHRRLDMKAAQLASSENAVGLVLVDGWPIAHHVFEGNRRDAKTVPDVLRDL